MYTALYSPFLSSFFFHWNRVSGRYHGGVENLFSGGDHGKELTAGTLLVPWPACGQLGNSVRDIQDLLLETESLSGGSAG